MLVVLTFFLASGLKADWLTIYTANPSTIWDIKFYDANTGWVIGENGVIQKTTNGGLNWTLQNSGSPQILRRMKIINKDTVFISGHNGTILRTTNGGTNWINSPTVGNFYGGMDAWQDSLIYCGGSSLRFAKTTNTGNNWTSGIIAGTLFDIYALDVIDSDIIYITGSPVSGLPRILRSTDGGANYSIIYTPPTIPYSGTGFNDIYFLDANKGFACTSNGRMIRTTNAGSSWDTTTLLAGNVLRKIEFLNADTGFVCGSSGAVFGTTNGGQSWMQMSAGVAQSFTGIALNGGYIYCAGESGIVMRSLIYIAPPVVVTGALFGNGIYSSLTAAFNAINAFTQTGANISITLHSGTLETGNGAILNNGSWSSLTISPKPGAAVTVAGSVNSGSAVITLNGADNVLIDGINSGGSSLNIFCHGNPGSPGSAVLKIQSDAVNNKVRRCTITGSFYTDFTFPAANIIIGAGAVATGNDNNVIDDCTINPAPGSSTACAIYLQGTNNAGQINNNDTIRNCNIYGYFTIYSASTGIYAGSGNGNIIITGNKLYQPYTLTFFSYNVTHTAIQINNNSAGGFEITGNTIGYSTPIQTGFYNADVQSYVSFYMIRVKTSAAVTSMIKDNTIAGISATGLIANFNAIYIDEGLVTVNSNTIGSQTQESILLNANSEIHCEFNGIKSLAYSNLTTNSNNIGGITMSQAQPAYSFSFNGIWFYSSGNITWQCNNNIIGGPSLNSIKITSTNHFSGVKGINAYTNSGGTPLCSLNVNIIRNLSTVTGSVFGIYIYPPAAGNYHVYRNTIHSLINNGILNVSNSVTGIRAASFGVTATITGNFIHSLSMGNAGGTVTGINLDAGNYIIYNNMIRLGINSSGVSEPVNHLIYGIFENNGANNIYFNSVYIGGTASSGTSNSYCFFSNEVIDTRNHKNNIYYNARTNSGATGKHYAIKLQNNQNLNSDYNHYYSSGTGGVLGLYFGVDHMTLASWRLGTGRDYSSITGDPLFVKPASNSDSVDLHLKMNTPCESAGQLVAAVNVDFDIQSRTILTPTDIGADAGDFITTLPAEALSFDGIDDHVTLPASLSNTLTAPAVTEITIEYWFKGSNLQSAVRIQTVSGYIVAGWGTPGAQKHLISTEGGTTGINVGAAATDGSWHHVAMTWKKNTVNGFRSYLDGTLVDQKNSSNTNLPNMNTECYLGRFALGSEFMNGALDGVRIWTRALSQSEIAANMNTEIGSGTGLLASYYFNQGVFPGNNSGINVLNDTTANNYNGTLNNFALSGGTSNWIRPGAMMSPPDMSIELKVIQEGFYNTLTSGLNMTDTVSVYLCSDVAPYNAIDSAKGRIDSLTNTGSFNFGTVTSGNYYIKVKHRNCIETWSATPVSIPATVSYDLTTSSSQAFGSNMKQVSTTPLRFAIYSGDVDGNGSVSLSDIINIYNDAGSFLTGYVNSDLNGDNLVNLNDLTLAYNNAALFVNVVKP